MRWFWACVCTPELCSLCPALSLVSTTSHAGSRLPRYSGYKGSPPSGTLECRNCLQPSGSVSCNQGLFSALPPSQDGTQGFVQPKRGLPLPRSLAEVLAVTGFGVTAMTCVLLSLVLSEASSGSHTELAALSTTCSDRGH